MEKFNAYIVPAVLTHQQMFLNSKFHRCNVWMFKSAQAGALGVTGRLQWQLPFMYSVNQTKPATI
jgi:hypothetical protein